MDELLSIGLSDARQYMSLPASQYSVLDTGSIERVDNSTFRCYVYNFKFFAFEVCPVLLVRVEEEPNGFCIKLLSCKNEKIDASMVNRVSCNRKQSDSSVDELTSDIAIEVSIEIPFAFRPIPVQAIESNDTQVLEQILRIMLPCFMAQEKGHRVCRMLLLNGLLEARFKKRAIRLTGCGLCRDGNTNPGFTGAPSLTIRPSAYRNL
ncbi:hypothetical protein HYC85_019230 [Camellia sinensis]|uniref:Uncharacterized protein n=1 Tax=Camellia sinensis TaxID=4442 RepID=A0A7J7GQA8_CAMSI|nr:hypothetical protein HYC85_019230 [Camellia sinensis]